MNLALEQQDLYNPIDTIEGIFSHDNVSFDRRKDNELVAEVLGKWDNMLIFLRMRSICAVCIFPAC